MLVWREQGENTIHVPGPQGKSLAFPLDKIDKDRLALAAHHVNMNLPGCHISGYDAVARADVGTVKKRLLDITSENTTPLKWQLLFTIQEAWDKRANADGELFGFSKPPVQIDDCPECKKDSELVAAAKVWQLDLSDVNLSSIRGMLDSCYGSADPKGCFQKVSSIMRTISGGMDVYLQNLYRVVPPKKEVMDFSGIEDESKKKEWLKSHKPVLLARVYISAEDEAKNIQEATDKPDAEVKFDGAELVLTTKYGVIGLSDGADKDEKRKQLPIIRMLKGETGKLESLLDSKQYPWVDGLSDKWSWDDAIVADRQITVWNGSVKQSHFIFQSNLLGVWQVAFRPPPAILRKFYMKKQK